MHQKKTKLEQRKKDMIKTRNEQQMMQLIMDVANHNPEIRAVLLNGSRANPNVEQDIFQDYDIIYAVKNLEVFLKDHSWIDVFGDRMILQMPEDMELYPPSPELEGAFSYLMQFMDGNRIDLILVPISNLHRFLKDSLCKLLLDKDDTIDLKSLLPASEHSYLVNKPTARAFYDCCNEFWYTSAGLAKSIWREQTIYARQLFHHVIHDTLIQMIDWHIGFRYQFLVNPGKYGKYYKQYLESDLYKELIETYRNAELPELWNALFLTVKLFQKVANHVAEQLGLSYPLTEQQYITEYLQHVKQLPKNAKQIY